MFFSKSSKMVNPENNRNLVVKPITEILQGSSKTCLRESEKFYVSRTENLILFVYGCLSDDDTRSRKFGIEMKRQNRRALGVINHNLVGAKAYPCVVNKRRGLSEYITKLSPTLKLVSLMHLCLKILIFFWDFIGFRRKQESCEKKKLDSLHPSISRLIKFKALKTFLRVCFTEIVFEFLQISGRDEEAKTNDSKRKRVR